MSEANQSTGNLVQDDGSPSSGPTTTGSDLFAMLPPEILLDIASVSVTHMNFLERVSFEGEKHPMPSRDTLYNLECFFAAVGQQASFAALSLLNRAWYFAITASLYRTTCLSSSGTISLFLYTLEDKPSLTRFPKSIYYVDSCANPIDSDRSRAALHRLLDICPLEQITFCVPPYYSFPSIFSPTSPVPRLRNLTLYGSGVYENLSVKGSVFPFLEVLSLRRIIVLYQSRFPTAPNLHTLRLTHTRVTETTFFRGIASAPSICNLELYRNNLVRDFCPPPFSQFDRVHLIGPNELSLIQKADWSEALVHSQLKHLALGLLDSTHALTVAFKFPRSLESLTFIVASPLVSSARCTPSGNLEASLQTVFKCLKNHFERIGGTILLAFVTIHGLLCDQGTWTHGDALDTLIEAIRELCSSKNILFVFTLIGECLSHSSRFSGRADGMILDIDQWVAGHVNRPLPPISSVL